ncbi:MAG TPA: YceH family protein [Acidimicrobiales bacterium]|nr:YceH family protein [Acidimicrobiales bacterium]
MEPLPPPQARVLGCLLEKQLATPQYYPLTLNALVAACNQSSNRDPVTDYQEAEVADAIAGLREQALVRIVHSAGNRVPKYRHVLDETWGLDSAHRAVLAVLLLRGPQTLGELRARTERLATFDSLDEIEEVLRLLNVRDVPLARLLERRPGQKEARYAHLMSGEVSLAAEHTPDAERTRSGPGLAERVAALEETVAALSALVEELRAVLE